MNAKEKNSGEIAEESVCKKLIKEGNTILDRNFATRYGEVDIIYIEKSSGDLVFAEVKYRQDNTCGEPYEYVTKEKIRRIESCAEFFLSTYYGKLPDYMRIDVFSVLGDFNNIEHFKNVTG